MKTTKIEVWIDTSPGGLSWDLKRTGVGRMFAKPEGPYQTRATLIITKPNTTPKKTCK